MQPILHVTITSVDIISLLVPNSLPYYGYAAILLRETLGDDANLK